MGQMLYKVSALKKDLIAYYRENESTMPVAPLVEDNAAELTKFYVRPPMTAYNKPNAFGQKTQSDEDNTTKIHSYRELLFKDNEPYRGIYITADAGMGKTSFAKMLALTWCEAHAPKKQTFKDVILFITRNRSPRTDNVFSFDPDDLDAMNRFDFLFFIKLREFESSVKCSLDEMILQWLKSILPHNDRYTNEFIEDILCNKRCLVVVDGLDEWTHPQSCKKKEVIPHKKHWPGSTVLTTTRPWKLITLRLFKNDIDRHLELSELDKTAAENLETLAIEFLNENQRHNKQVASNSNTKTVKNFRETVPVKLLPEIRYIPFVLLQMICLWFEDCIIGRSLCEVYSNIIELTIRRWLVKQDPGHTHCKCRLSKDYGNIEIKCMKNNTHCRINMSLLTKIGELAFSTLFSVIQENSLLFDSEQVLNYLGIETELPQCLNMGLISQVKDRTFVSQVRMQYYFPHKTFHEFFCALFIATNWNDTETKKSFIKEKLSDKSNSVSDILEMSKVFVFVCGLNPEVFSDISHHLATIVDKDITVIDYRNSIASYHQSLADYQKMQISCFLESNRNENSECKTLLKDILLDERVQVEELPVLLKILSNNTNNIKSLLFSYPFEVSEARTYEILERSKYSCLETLRVESDNTSRVVPFLPTILTTAANTLKHLYLLKVIVTTDIAVAISALNNLRVLRLSDIDVSADNLNAMCTGNCISLQRLYLTNLKYIEEKKILAHERRARIHDNDSDRNNYVLDLTRHNKLQELEMEVPLAELYINTENLVKCEIRNIGKFSAHAVSTLLTELNGAPMLKTFKLIHIGKPPPTSCITDQGVIQKAEYALEHFNLRDSTSTITQPRVTQFTQEHCYLRESTVTLTQPRLTGSELIFCYFGDITMTKFALTYWHLRNSTLTLILPQVTEFTMDNSDIRDSTLTLTLPQVAKFTLESPDSINSTLTLPQIKEFTVEHSYLRNKTLTLTLPQATKFILEISDLMNSITNLPLSKAREFTLEYGNLRDSTITMTLPQVTEFTLEHSDLRDRTPTSTLTQVTKFALAYWHLKDSTLTLTLPQVGDFTMEHSDIRDSTLILTLPQVTNFTLEKLDIINSTFTSTLPQVRKFTMEGSYLKNSTLTLTLPQATTFILEHSDQKYWALRDNTLTLPLKHVTIFALKHCNLRDSTLTLTLQQVREFTLEHCQLSDSTVTLTLPLLRELKLIYCRLKGSAVILSRGMTKLETICFWDTRLCITFWKKLFLSIIELSQHITLEVSFLSMKEGEWRELLFDMFGKLRKSIQLKLSRCTGPSVKEWKDIRNDMQASQAFHVERFFINNEGLPVSASFVFDTVVV